MRRITALLLAMSLLCFSSCARQSGSDKERSDFEKQGGFLEEGTASSDYQMAAKPMAAENGSGNELGFYEIERAKDGLQLLMFTDYATAQKVPVCSAPNCSHQNESCTAFVEQGRGVFPIADEDQLLLVYGGGRNHTAKIEAMNLDGSNRHVLCSFEDGMHLRNGAAMNSKHLVLCFSKAVPDGENQEGLLQVDLDTGEVQELYRYMPNEEESQNTLFLMGIAKDGFVLRQTGQKAYETSSDITTELKNLQAAFVCRILKVSFDGTEQTELLCEEGNLDSEQYGERGLVILRFEQGHFLLSRLDEAAKQVIPVLENLEEAPQIHKTEQPLESADLYLADVLENYALLNHCVKTETNEAGELTVYYTQYAVDLDTGAVTEITLTDGAKGVQMAPKIRAQWGDTLLVNLAEEETPFGPRRKTAFIKTEDYLGSNPAYTTVKTQAE